MPVPPFRYIGRGGYSLPEAERLTGVPRRSIRRWTTGYDWNSRGTLRRSPPVIGGELSNGDLDATLAISQSAFEQQWYAYVRQRYGL